MKSAFIFISTIALTLTLSSCSQAPLPKHSIIKETPNVALSKNNLEVRLESKVDEATLETLSNALRSKRKQYERLWIQYFLPATSSRNDVWATASFTPSGVDIDIVGSTEAEDKQTENTGNIDGEVIGRWRSENSLMGATLVMYKTLHGETITRSKYDFKTKSRSKETVEIPAGALIMQITHKDGSQSKEPLKVTDTNGTKRYDYENKHGEYYQLMIGLTFVTKLETVLSPLMRLPLLVVGIALMNSGTTKPTDKKVVSKNQKIQLIGILGLLIFIVIRLIIKK